MVGKEGLVGMVGKIGMVGVVGLTKTKKVLKALALKTFIKEGGFLLSRIALQYHRRKWA